MAYNRNKKNIEEALKEKAEPKKSVKPVKKTTNKQAKKPVKKNFKPKNTKKNNDEVVKDAWKDVPVYVEYVNHPNHYIDNFSGIEVIETNCDLTNCLSNVFKYCMRAGKKDSILQELEKAKFYCNFYIEGCKSGKITPQNKITYMTYENIYLTAQKAMDIYNSITGPTEREWLIKADLFTHFYAAIKATQEIVWWKFNRNSQIKIHLENLENVKTCIELLIEYYKEG